METAGILVSTLHEAAKDEQVDSAKIRSIKELAGTAKELTALVKSIGEHVTAQTGGTDSITVRFMNAEEFTN